MAATPQPTVDRDADPSGALTPAGAGGGTLDDPAVLIGQVIAERYRVMAVLGRGGMGAVLRCHHLGLRRDVAVKLLHPEIAADPEIAARFEREASSASRLDHPNCVRVLDFGVWQPMPGAPVAKYLAMQLLEGEELAALMGQPLPARRAIGLVQQILAALEHAHAHGIVHRDLKPENVFVTRDHEGVELLKLVDFGIAKIIEGEGANAKLTRMGVVFGTPRYMSPEQAAGGTVDERADLYSTGIMLYELLAGLPPFVGNDAMQLLRKHLFELPPPLPDSVPPALKAVVARLLEKERDARFATATEVRASLAAIDAELAAPPVSAPATHPTLRSITQASMVPVGFTAPARRDFGWRRYAPHAGIAVLLVIGLVVALRPAKPEPADSPQSGGPSATAPTAQMPAMGWAPAVGASPVPVAVPSPKAAVEAGSLLEVDAMLARGEYGPALKRMDALSAEQPDTAQLDLRRARALAADPKRQVEALDAYRRAIEADATVLDDRDVIARLYALLRTNALRTQATELTLASLGGEGLPLLVEFVHAPRPVLAYDLRHRALAAISAVPNAALTIDVSLQRSLDLWQAAKTEAPCEHFAEALDEIAKDPTPGVLGTLHRVTPPLAPEGANSDTVARCSVLPARLVAVRAIVVAAHPISPNQWTVPPAYADVGKKKRRRGFLGRVFGG